MAFTFKSNRKRLGTLKKRVESFQGTEIQVGFFPEDRYGAENGNLPVAQVAAFNVFGTTKNPTRDFMTPSFEDAMSQLGYAKAMTRMFYSLIRDGRRTPTMLKKIGEMVKDVIQVNIDDYPGSNSAAWAAYKGFNDPLFHTGKMLESVKFKVVRSKS